MSRLVSTFVLLAPVAAALAGCTHTAVSHTPSWNKHYVAGSRIARKLDPQGQPLTGQQVVTITDEQLNAASGVLLGDKLNGGYSR